MSRTDEDRKEIDSFPNRQQMARVVSSNNSPPLSNLRNTFVSLENSAHPFRQSSEIGTPFSSVFGTWQTLLVSLRHSSQLFRHTRVVHLWNRNRSYFPKNDSSAAGVRWTELMFRRIRSLTEEVAFDENDWILMSLVKTKICDTIRQRFGKRDAIIRVDWKSTKIMFRTYFINVALLSLLKASLASNLASSSWQSSKIYRFNDDMSR